MLLAILPKQHDIALPAHAPRWRDWKDSRRESIPFEEYHQARAAVVTRFLDDVSANGKRWSDVLQVLGDLPHDQIVSALENAPLDDFAEEDRTMVWRALRSVISKHRSFADADWAVEADIMDRLERVYESFTPHDPVQRVAWLFAQRPDLLQGGQRERESYLQEVQDAQVNAIRTVLMPLGGLAELLHLAHLVERPEVVGQIIALTTSAASENERAILLDLLDAPDTANRRLARAYATQRFDLGGWQWARPVLENAAQEWSPEKRAALLWALPFVPETWDWAKRYGEDTERTYWRGAPLIWINDPAAVERAARLLVQYERPDHAIHLLGMLLQGAAPRINPELVVGALEQFVHQGDLNHWGGLADEVATLLDYLATSGTVDISRLAQLEWSYLPLLRALGRSAGVLSRELTQNPAFFMEVLCAVFHAHDEEPHEATDEQKAAAMLGYQLLDSWQRPPGYRYDGTVDEEALNAWVDTARSLAAAHRREKIADQQIGRVVSCIPVDPDGLWPHRSVRTLVERIASHDLETGVEIGLHNNRGVTMRGFSDGGAQERALQTQYLDYAQHLNADWPRTAALLRRIARSFAEEARWHDGQAEIAENHTR